MKNIKQIKRYRRRKRVRSRIFGTAVRPRLSVFRSAKHIYTQLIDDEKGQTLVAASDLEIKRVIKHKKTPLVKVKDDKKEKVMAGKSAIAHEVGKLIAEKAAKKKIGKAVFDRGGNRYHGRIKALAEGAREGGLKF